MMKFVTKDNIIIVLVLVILGFLMNFKYRSEFHFEMNYNRILGNQHELQQTKEKLEKIQRRLKEIESQVKKCK